MTCSMVSLAEAEVHLSPSDHEDTGVFVCSEKSCSFLFSPPLLLSLFYIPLFPFPLPLLPPFSFPLYVLLSPLISPFPFYHSPPSFSSLSPNPYLFSYVLHLTYSHHMWASWKQKLGEKKVEREQKIPLLLTIKLLSFATENFPLHIPLCKVSPLYPDLFLSSSPLFFPTCLFSWHFCVPTPRLRDEYAYLECPPSTSMGPNPTY